MKRKSSVKIGEEFEELCENVLKSVGMVTWRPRKSRSFRKGENGGTDIFGLFDIVAVSQNSPNNMVWVQCKKNKNNISKDLRKKIEEFKLPELFNFKQFWWFNKNNKIVIENWNEELKKWETELEKPSPPVPDIEKKAI